ncbi:hypothetical protein IFM89_034808 [Coptis chinensis]|uniref:Uncharacterized protein n=1 Tax=Coptis chinensis TaxID=261450 RepID=A0A835H9E4_9MAGN|nr:hypothetical protein IFM89_034808 [Coptis chinensis]
MGVQAWYKQSLGCGFSDAVFCNGCFYFVTCDYKISVVDAKSMIAALKEGEDVKDKIELQLHHLQVEMPDRRTRTNLRLYLVESCGGGVAYL